MECFDIVICNGRLIDGTGAPAHRADLGLSGGRIEATGDLSGAEAGQVIDASGLVVTPGFIDLHTHSDATLLVNPLAESSVHQGVTTEVVGNCGHSAAPAPEPELARSILLGVQDVDIAWRDMAGYLRTLEELKPAINVGALVGHGTLRLAAMGFASRPAETAEIETEVKLARTALEQGALGLSLGLEYAPGNNSEERELLALAQVVAEANGILTSHVRNRDYRYLAATKEMLNLVEKTGVRLQLSHFTAKYGAAKGEQEVVYQLLDQVVEGGADVAADMMPYVWCMSSLPSAILPPTAFEGGHAELRKRLQNPAQRAAFKRYDNPLWKIISAGLWQRLVLLATRSHPEYAGRTVAALAEATGKEPYDLLFDLMLDEGDHMYSISWAGESVEEDDLQQALRHELVLFASDGMALAPYGRLAGVAWHPTAYGWTSRVLARYVRELQMFTLEEAVRKMTSMPAMRLGLFDRGVIKVGNWADLAIFDPAKVQDHSNVYRANQYASGFEYVLVNGEIVFANGEHTGRRPGQVLRA